MPVTLPKALTLWMPHVDIAALRAIQRAAAGLDQALEPDSVVETLQAAELYMIKELADECHRYMRDEINPDAPKSLLALPMDMRFQMRQNVPIGALFFSTARQFFSRNLF